MVRADQASAPKEGALRPRRRRPDRSPTLRVGRRRRLRLSALFQRMEHGARLLTFDRHFEEIDGRSAGSPEEFASTIASSSSMTYPSSGRGIAWHAMRASRAFGRERIVVVADRDRLMRASRAFGKERIVVVADRDRLMRASRAFGKERIVVVADRDRLIPGARGRRPDPVKKGAAPERAAARSQPHRGVSARQASLPHVVKSRPTGVFAKPPCGGLAGRNGLAPVPAHNHLASYLRGDRLLVHVVKGLLPRILARPPFGGLAGRFGPTPEAAHNHIAENPRRRCHLCTL